MKELLGKGANLWKHIIGNLDAEFQEEFDFSFLKGCAKRLCYKALQGGRIDTAVKIQRTLKLEEAQAKKSLESLAKSFHKNDLLLEFDLLNQAIMDKFKRHKQLRVYMPIDKTPFTFVRQASALKTKNWYTENPCRVTSQIVTGVEMMQTIFMVEQMQQLQLKWLPVSLHHDGCALLVEESSFEEGRQKLREALKQRLEPSGMQINRVYPI
uniref:Uncharacterized protein orf210a n=1 Tax=Staurastrum punctulatum TaxID=102822 RepID=Q32RR1_STAPU|nr:hypothetical protein StpuCp102 [Staurastrum punctulatum]AAX45778.1 hypothetical protein [Staurastrum punctulatum]